MNGERSTFMLKGYWLTALATAVLLAASSGTAQAQVLTGLKVTITGPNTVAEGESVTVTVRGEAMVGATTDTNNGDDTASRRVRVYLLPSGASARGTATMGEFDVSRQVDDVSIPNSVVTLTFAENTAAADTDPRPRTVTGSVTLQTNQDPDAENERITVGVDTGDGTNNTGFDLPTDVTGPSTTVNPATLTFKTFTIADDETQTYVLSLDDDQHSSTEPPTEGLPVYAVLKAKPSHYQGGELLTLQLSQNGGGAKGYSAMGMGAGANNMSTAAIGTANPVAGGDAFINEAGIPSPVNSRAITIVTPPNDQDRGTDMIILEAHSGAAGRDSLASSLDVDVLDVHQLPAADAITVVAEDEDGNEVTEVMEGGDPVFLTLTVDRGRGTLDRITDEKFDVNIRPADSAQLADYELSESRIELESRSSGKQTNDTEIELSARSDDDVGMEYLVLNFEVAGDSDFGTETSTGTFSIAITDDTAPKVSPKSEAEAYPMIRAALGNDPETTVMNPGEKGTIMMGDLFMTMEGYDASYKVSESGGAVSVTAPGDMVTITANAVGTSKVTVTATAEMAASSFLPEQTMSDEASITFEVMVAEEGAPMPEPVPALPLIAQWLLGLGLMGGGARQLFRRRSQS